MITTETDATHDPARRSWVESAEDPASDFPLQNLPLGRLRRPDEAWRLGVAIGDQALDLGAVAPLLGLADPELERALASGDGNALFALGRPALRALRAAVSALLERDDARLRDDAALRARALLPQAGLELGLPCAIGDYTDYYASVHHATNVGRLFRPDNPLLPNYKWIPIGYHGRASSIVPTGTPVVRPHGQTKADDQDAPTFGPCRLLDYEVEVGAFVGAGNALGAPIPLARAEDHLVGLVLVNDWSARDVQKWEYQPLGPFLAKSFATTISPWVVTLDALAPFRAPAFARDPGDPRPLPYLDDPDDQRAGAFDVAVECWLASARMRAEGVAPVRLSRGRLADMYWSFGQMLAHHASNGCNLRPGDLLASGTVSGPAKEHRGCLLELTVRGQEPITLPTGEVRRFLQDGDEVTLRGRCERPGLRSIGFGPCAGVVVGAPGA